jgi:hypothetical protein
MNLNMRFEDVLMLLLDRLSQRSAGAHALKSLIILETEKWHAEIAHGTNPVSSQHGRALVAPLLETEPNSPASNTGTEDKELKVLVCVTRTIDNSLKDSGSL